MAVEDDVSLIRTTTLVAPTRPTITVPHRPPAIETAAYFFGGGDGLSLSPGPLSFVSSLFVDNFPDVLTPDNQRTTSFTQLLNGTMSVSHGGGGRSTAGMFAGGGPMFTIPSGSRIYQLHLKLLPRSMMMTSLSPDTGPIGRTVLHTVSQ